MTTFSQVVFQCKNLRALSYLLLERLKEMPKEDAACIPLFSRMVQSMSLSYLSQQPEIQAKERDNYMAVLEFVMKNGQDYLGTVVKFLEQNEDKHSDAGTVSLPFNQLAAYTFICNCMFYRTIMSNQEYEKNLEYHSHSVENATYAIQVLKDSIKEGEVEKSLFDTEHDVIADGDSLKTMTAIGLEPLDTWKQQDKEMPKAFRVADDKHVVHLFTSVMPSMKHQLARLYALRNHFQNIAKKVSQTQGAIILDDLHEALQLNPHDPIALKILSKDFEQTKQPLKAIEKWNMINSCLPHGHPQRSKHAFTAAHTLLKIELAKDDKLANAFKNPVEKENADYLQARCESMSPQIETIFEHYQQGIQFEKDTDAELAPFHDDGLYRKIPSRDKLSVELFLAWSNPDSFGDLTVCDHCGKAGGVSTLKQCAACKSVLYCNRDCQKSAWLKHKPTCSIAKGAHSK